MNITVFGGAGVRAPLLIGSLAKRARRVDIDEVCIYDIDPLKVKTVVPLCEALLEQAGNPYRLRVAATPEEAVKRTDAVITTIRDGFEIGRAHDERACLDRGVIGQETTGAAGFAFACRSVPALMHYARLTFDANPDAWLLNFTNPAGITSQALRAEGFDRVLGICDSADSAKLFVGDHLNVDKSRIDTRVAGLNHLSFTTSIKVDGQERLPGLLEDPLFLEHAQAVFDPALPKRLGCYLNEYLYYFFRTDHALKSMMEEEKCRGERIVEWNRTLLDDLQQMQAIAAQKRLDRYFDYTRARNESYMDYATGAERYLPTDEEEGYAGVALDFIEAWAGAAPSRQAFIVPNQGVFDYLADEDIIEVSCDVAEGALTPLDPGDLPAEAHALIKSVKTYESLAVRAIRERSLELAQEALAANPLVPDKAKAAELVDVFSSLQADCFKEWT